MSATVRAEHNTLNCRVFKGTKNLFLANIIKIFCSNGHFVSAFQANLSLFLGHSLPFQNGELLKQRNSIGFWVLSLFDVMDSVEIKLGPLQIFAHENVRLTRKLD